ncbi:hypothetical protein EIP91_009007 [Steccherinum ochraceum]|uniref:Nicotinamide-nucleotide adenylyltransferase n=1 Tax=Steccherinum ochraceum TaxID=92696 RepID=A0A4V2MV58_9APHY|nr:hypothetical protein EIP91_009007 [Steccherinum ochraceum]
MASRFEAQLHRLRQSQGVEYVYTSHDRWPLPRYHKHPTGSRLNISVLDSSFNPPTLAHLALAKTPFPECFRSTPPKESDVFQAKLLLLSVRNADKSLKQSDATHAQRLEMMLLLAQDLSSHGAVSSGDSQGVHTSEHDSNIAVAIIDEPTFVGKSKALLSSLQTRISQLSGSVHAEAEDTAPSVKAALTFIVGMDTLDRIFTPRFYGSAEAMATSLQTFFSTEATGDNSRVICARRLGLKEDPAMVEKRTLDAARTFVEARRIALADIDEAIATYSSSEVRDRINNGHDDAPWTALVTERIAEYVNKNKLYLDLS